MSIISIITVLMLAGCSSSNIPQRDDGVFDVVTTTPVLADIVRNVAGDDVRVTSLMPIGADPHSFEPTLRSIRSVANADLAFSHHLLLEQQSLQQAVESNLRPGVRHVKLAEESSAYGVRLIPLVEDLSLDTVWLGMRILGKPETAGLPKDSRLQVVAEDLDGPGDMSAFITGTFGRPELFITSADGLDPRSDRLELPPNAHTHMSWLFTQPGQYRLTLRAEAIGADGAHTDLGRQVFTFAVGIDPHQVTLPSAQKPQVVLDSGHQDIAVDLQQRNLHFHGDAVESEGSHDDAAKDIATAHDPNATVIAVPTKSLQTIPANPQFRAVGRPGTEAYMLRQAVLGKHVHGDIDPHVWLDAANVKAFVGKIRDELVRLDPEHARDYSERAENYSAQLDELDEDMRAMVNTLPPERRYLVTTHDAYGYLGSAYGLKIAGFVSPNPAVEPSPRDLTALSRTLDELTIPAVFLEPNLSARSKDLTQMAAARGINVCPIYGDAFDEKVTTYVGMMRANEASISRCLGGKT